MEAVWTGFGGGVEGVKCRGLGGRWVRRVVAPWRESSYRVGRWAGSSYRSMWKCNGG